MMGSSYHARANMDKEFPPVCEGCGTPVNLNKVKTNEFGMLFVECACGRCVTPRIPEQLRKILEERR